MGAHCVPAGLQAVLPFPQPGGTAGGPLLLVGLWQHLVNAGLCQAARELWPVLQVSKECA